MLDYLLRAHTLRILNQNTLLFGTTLEEPQCMTTQNFSKLSWIALTMCCLDKCKTILRLLPFKVLNTILILSTAACNPQTVNNITQHHVSNPNPSEKNNRGGGGTGDGGGGQGILCGNDVSDPYLSGNLMVRDIYEAIYNHRRVMRFDLPKKGGKQVDEDAIKSLVTAIKSYFGPASAHLDFAQEKYWQDFANNISFTPKGSNLIPSSDANSPLAVPNGCEIVQIAYWDESAGPIENGTLYVDQKYWEQLNQFNKIALLTHEYFFKQARKAGYKNSDFIRFKVGQLLSKEGLEPLFKDWTPSKDPRVKDILPEARDGFKYCEGTSTEDPDSYLQLFQYQGKNEEQHIVIPVLKSSNINHPLLQSIRMTFDPRSNLPMKFFSDFLLLERDHRIKNKFYYDTRDVLFEDEREKANLVNLFDDRSVFEMWHDLRYSLSGLLLSKYRSGTYSLNETIIDTVEKMPDYKGEIFRTTIYSNKGPIQLSIPATLNPNKYNNSTLKSPQELLNKINQTIGEKIFRSPWPEEELAILEAISILHNEIDNAIATGKSMREFPKWLAALENIVTASEGDLDSRLLNDKKVIKELPELLYKLKLKISTNMSFAFDESFYDQFLEAGIDIHNNPKMKNPFMYFTLNQGVIAISQGPHKVEFRLECKDYLNLFQEGTKKERSAQLQQTINKNVSISYLFDSSIPYPTDLDWNTQSFEQYRLRNFQFLRSFIDYISSEKIKSYYDLMKLGDKECFYKISPAEIPTPMPPAITLPISPSMPPLRNCQSISGFYSALFEESKISVVDCYGYGIGFGPKEVFKYRRSIKFKKNKMENEKYCAVINFENTMERYMVVFSKPPFDMTKNGNQAEDFEPIKNEKYYLPPSIHLVLQVP